MIKALDFRPQLAVRLPETYALLRASNLTVHTHVSSVILHGSRGLAAKYRSDSDIDLSLIVDLPADGARHINLLASVYQTTRESWKSSVELDLAVVFDKRGCGLKCFDENTWNAELCHIGGTDCFGLYKLGKGFDGLVTQSGVQVERMYPCLKIWERG